MSRPGFYNDNEYRVYPFVYKSNLTALPDEIVVDAGFIMGLDCDFDDAVHTVWLDSITVDEDVITAVFKTDATTAPLAFVFPATVERWSTVYAESAVAPHECAEEPIWSGFIVLGRVATSETLSFTANNYQIEPARIQNLNKAYVRSISVGNYSRVTVPPCNSEQENVPIDLAARTIIPNRTCMKGPIAFKEGYNCLITQTDRDNSITVGAAKGAGQKEDAALCEAGGEVPLFEGEQPPAGSKFLSGGPACNELIFTLNGVGGSNVNIVGGQNIIVRGGNEGDPDNVVQVSLNSNIQGNCNG